MGQQKELAKDAEIVFCYLARLWINGFKASKSNNAKPPKEIDYIPLAALLLRWTLLYETWSAPMERATRKCMDLASEHMGSWYVDQIPWEMCRSRYGTPDLEKLYLNLDNGNSIVRGALIEAAWMGFSVLNKDRVLPSLMRNIADTIFYVEESTELALRFFRDLDDFMYYVQEDAPQVDDDFVSQYSERIFQIETAPPGKLNILHRQQNYCISIIRNAYDDLFLLPPLDTCFNSPDIPPPEN